MANKFLARYVVGILVFIGSAVALGSYTDSYPYNLAPDTGYSITKEVDDLTTVDGRHREAAPIAPALAASGSCLSTCNQLYQICTFGCTQRASSSSDSGASCMSACESSKNSCEIDCAKSGGG